MEEQKLSLINLEDGAAIEMFDNALQQVIENIPDINTTLDAREISLKVTIKPMDENRSIIVYGIKCPTKICGQQAVRGVADIRIKEGRLAAFGRQKDQPQLSFANITSINKGE